MPSENPFIPKPRSQFWGIIRPSTFGVLSGAIFAASPKCIDIELFSKISLLDKIPGISALPDRVFLALVGFCLGISFAKGCNWIRWKLLKKLLGYSGWVQDARSYKTKAWAMLLQLVKGPRPYSTFAFQPYLPKQPLPGLDETLDRWLNTTKLILSKEDFDQTKEAVEEFRANEGPILQKYLQEKAEQKDSWIHEYWLSGVYLSSRSPLSVYSNYYVSYAVPARRTTDQLARAANDVVYTLQFAQMLEEDRLPPVELQDLVPLCMSGYRYLFNCSRIPGEYIDDIRRFTGKKHIIVTRKGFFFKLEPYHRDADGKVSIPSPDEMKLALKNIMTEADNLKEDVLPVAALTGQKRNIWAQHRLELIEKNAETVMDIESAMFILDLEDRSPANFSEASEMEGNGNTFNRWFDKSFTKVVFENTWTGFNVEHSVLDAMVILSLCEYIMVMEKYDENGDVIKDSNRPQRMLSSAKRLQWDVTGMEEKISTAATELGELIGDIDHYIVNAIYGKGVMKKVRCSPDGFIQMAIQLAYYKMHKSIVKTYEPSTGRLYLLGRTETINVQSQMSVDWVNAMQDPDISSQTKQELCKKAIKHQSQQRLQATIGKGCDRHLFALMCASRENGMDFPKMFVDKAWQQPYVLSTSQTPTRSYELGVDGNFPSCSGGFAPSCHNGYGLAYGHFGDETLNISVSSWKSCKETDSYKFGQALQESLAEMKKLFTKN